jgi:hypothetical protein
MSQDADSDEDMENVTAAAPMQEEAGDGTVSGATACTSR